MKSEIGKLKLRLVFFSDTEKVTKWSHTFRGNIFCSKNKFRLFHFDDLCQKLEREYFE